MRLSNVENVFTGIISKLMQQGKTNRVRKDDIYEDDVRIDFQDLDLRITKIIAVGSNQTDILRVLARPKSQTHGCFR